MSIFVVFVETASYGYCVIEVTDLVIESYPVIVIKVTVIEKGQRSIIIKVWVKLSSAHHQLRTGSLLIFFFMEQPKWSNVLSIIQIFNGKPEIQETEDMESWGLQYIAVCRQNSKQSGSVHFFKTYLVTWKNISGLPLCV